MKRYLFVVLCLLGGAEAFADGRAVEEASYRVGIESGDVYRSGERDVNFLGINGGATFPLGTYLGGSLAASYVSSDVGGSFRDQNPGVALADDQPSCSVRESALGASVFARDPSLGRIGAGVREAQSEPSCDAVFLVNGSDTLDTTSYSGNAEIYLERVTLAAALTRTRLDGADDLVTATLTASWYPANNFRLDLSGDGGDVPDTQRIGFEYQPDFFGTALRLRLAYARQDQAVDVHFITFGLIFDFGKAVDLITGDRRFR
jgi:hypothetical protein